MVFRRAVADCSRMILTQENWRASSTSGTAARISCSAMHPLEMGRLVVRACCQRARVEISPTHEKSRPNLKLERLHDCGLFEGLTTSNRVYAYDLIITTTRAHSVHRDAYSFLPTLGEDRPLPFRPGKRKAHSTSLALTCG